MGSVVPRGAVDRGGFGAIAGGSPDSGLLGIEADAMLGVRPVAVPATLPDAPG